MNKRSGGLDPLTISRHSQHPIDVREPALNKPRASLEKRTLTTPGSGEVCCREHEPTKKNVSTYHVRRRICIIR